MVHPIRRVKKRIDFELYSRCGVLKTTKKNDRSTRILTGKARSEPLSETRFPFRSSRTGKMLYFLEIYLGPGPKIKLNWPVDGVYITRNHHFVNCLISRTSPRLQ